MEVLRPLQGFFRERRHYLFLSILCLAVATALGLVYPNLLQRLIDNAIIPGDFEKVPALALTVLGVVVVKGFMQFLSFRYYDIAKTGDLMSRLTGDLEAIRNFIGFGFAQLLNVVLMVVFGSMMT
jgi:ATP-binding cassette subfamily B protein